MAKTTTTVSDSGEVKVRKPRKPSEPRPVFVVCSILTDETGKQDVSIIAVSRKAENVLAKAFSVPGAIVKKVMVD